jgi:hypothetical protein
MYISIPGKPQQKKSAGSAPSERYMYGGRLWGSWYQATHWEEELPECLIIRVFKWIRICTHIHRFIYEYIEKSIVVYICAYIQIRINRCIYIICLVPSHPLERGVTWGRVRVSTYIYTYIYINIYVYIYG